MFPIKWQEGRQPRRLLCFSAAFFMVTVIFTLLFTHVESYANIVMMTAAAALLISAAVTYALQENFHVFASVYFGLARNDNAPGVPSSIFAKVYTSAFSLPITSPFMKDAICFAVNFISCRAVVYINAKIVLMFE